jgi:HNH endonuclease
MKRGDGFTDATKVGIGVLQRLGKVSLGGELCPWCKVRPADEVDHIEARANGGNNSIFNGMWICRACNRRKSASDLEDWIEFVMERENVMDIEVWLRSRDKDEYALLIGRKLRKQMGWKASEPASPEVDVVYVRPRPNPANPINGEARMLSWYQWTAMGGW